VCHGACLRPTFSAVMPKLTKRREKEKYFVEDIESRIKKKIVLDSRRKFQKPGQNISKVVS
jgi:hypothetical protein